MAGAGKKTFTAGETLTASDVNTFLMEQSVMYFAGTAARSSAIPTPSTGMTSYIGVTGTATIPQIETYTGSAWQTPYGITQLANVSFASASTVQVDNVFSSTYDNYLLSLDITASGSFVVATQLCLSGTPASGATDYRRQDTVGIGSTTTSTGSSTSSTSIGVARNTRTLITSTIGNPAKALATSFIGQQADLDSTFTIRSTAGYHILANAYDGIRLSGFTSGTGTLRIYGYRNS